MPKRKTASKRKTVARSGRSTKTTLRAKTSKSKSTGRKRSSSRAKAASRGSSQSASQRGTPFEVLLVDLEPELATTRRVLERIPQSREEWKPHTKSRTLGELATHLAQLPGFGILMLTQDEFNGNPAALGGPRFSSNADRLKAFDQVSAELRRIVRQMTWDHARSPWALRVGDRTVLNAPRVDVFRTAFITHSAHHRAQLGVYLRLLEESVPATYGPSADEQFTPPS